MSLVIEKINGIDDVFEETKIFEETIIPADPCVIRSLEFVPGTIERIEINPPLLDGFDLVLRDKPFHFPNSVVDGDDLENKTGEPFCPDYYSNPHIRTSKPAQAIVTTQHGYGCFKTYVLQPHTKPTVEIHCRDVFKTIRVLSDGNVPPFRFKWNDRESSRVFYDGVMNVKDLLYADKDDSPRVKLLKENGIDDVLDPTSSLCIQLVFDEQPGKIKLEITRYLFIPSPMNWFQ